MFGDVTPGGSGSAPEGLGFGSSVPGSSIPGSSVLSRVSRRQRREMREQAGSTGVGSPLVAGSVVVPNPVHEVPAPHEPQTPYEPYLTPAFLTKAEPEPDWGTLMGEKPNKATSPVVANSPHRKRKTSISVLVISGVG